MTSAFRKIDQKTAEDILSAHLIGSSIKSVRYYITGWSLRILGLTGPQCTLKASDITLPNLELWRKKFVGFPTELLDTNEPDDVIIASVIFSVVNKWPISSIQIIREGDLVIGFENDSKIIIKAIVEYIDWTWQVDQEDGKNLVFCDSGEFSTRADNVQ